jgi:hypothetical protein
MVRKEVIFAIRMFLLHKSVNETKQDNDGPTNLALDPDSQFRNRVFGVGK